jgi:hypothetical protein
MISNGLVLRQVYAAAHTNRPNVGIGLTGTLPSAYSVSNGYTMMAWIKTYGPLDLDISSVPAIVVKNQAETTQHGPYYSYAGVAVMQVGADLTGAPSPVIRSHQWYHVAMTHIGGTVTVYLNGNYYFRWTGTENLVSIYKVGIASRPDYGFHYNTKVTDMSMQRIFDMVMTPKEIEKEMNSLLPVTRARCLFYVDPRSAYNGRAITPTSFRASGKFGEALTWAKSAWDGVGGSGAYNSSGVPGPQINNYNTGIANFSTALLTQPRNFGYIIF